MEKINRYSVATRETLKKQMLKGQMLKYNMLLQVYMTSFQKYIY